MDKPTLPRVDGGAIAIPFDRSAEPGELDGLREQGADLFELRLDMAGCTAPEDAASMAASFKGHPLLVSCRSKAQGGQGGEEIERLMLLAATVETASALDVEMASTAIVPETALVAQSNGCELVVSHHDTTHTPSAALLNEIAEQAAVAGADIIKIATVTASEQDVATLAEVLQTQLEQGRAIAVMGMGQTQTAWDSRVLLARQGSLFVFAQAGIESAPGQPRLDWLAQRLRNPESQ